MKHIMTKGQIGEHRVFTSPSRSGIIIVKLAYGGIIAILSRSPRRHNELMHTALHSALHCAALCCTAMHCAALHCTARHCTALHYTALHCTALHCRTSCVGWYENSPVSQGTNQPEGKQRERKDHKLMW